MTAGDPMGSVVDYDRAEARSAARDAADPWVEMTRAESLREEQELFFDHIHALTDRPGRGRQMPSGAAA